MLEGRAWVGVRLSYQSEEKGEGKRETDDQKDRLKEVENETHPDREGKMPTEMGGSPRKVLRKRKERKATPVPNLHPL